MVVSFLLPRVAGAPVSGRGHGNAGAVDAGGRPVSRPKRDAGAPRRGRKSDLERGEHHQRRDRRVHVAQRQHGRNVRRRVAGRLVARSVPIAVPLRRRVQLSRREKAPRAAAQGGRGRAGRRGVVPGGRARGGRAPQVVSASSHNGKS